MRTTYALNGHAAGHLSFHAPGGKALIDTYVVVRNKEEVDQGYLNSTLKWSTKSSWKRNGDIFMSGDLTARDTSSRTMKSWQVREALTYGNSQYRASTYLFEGSSEKLSAYGAGRYAIASGYDW